MALLWRLLLMISLAFWGLSLGTSLGGMFLVPPGQGLAGPVEALGYGLLTAVIVAAAALYLTRSWPDRRLRIAALGASLSALILGSYLYTSYLQRREAARDPDSAYAGIPTFTISWEQVVVKDPYLRTKMDVNSAKRRWVSVGPAPDNQVCQGTVRAAVLQKISASLEAIVASPSEFLAPCTETTAEVEQRISWDYSDGRSSGTLDVTPSCLEEREIVRDLTRIVFNASQSPTSPVRYD